jgi:pyruvate carboxylase
LQQSLKAVSEFWIRKLQLYNKFNAYSETPRMHGRILVHEIMGFLKRKGEVISLEFQEKSIGLNQTTLSVSCVFWEEDAFSLAKIIVRTGSG